MPRNQAAWLDGIGKPLRVGPAEMPRAEKGEIVIQNRAVAVNAVSWKIQDTGIVVKNMPTILDYDVAGEVYEVGSDVDNFKEGDGVLAFTGGPVSQQPREGAFQLYNVAKVELVAKIPNNIPFFDACVLPVAFSTAITGLCAPVGQGLGLPFPSLDPKPCGKTVVIWGASASTGILFLQIARAAGIETIAVASASNHELCKSHGAAVAVNHREPSVVEQVADAIKEVGGDFVGIVDCVSDPETSLPHCTAVLQKVGGGQLGLLLPDMQMKAPENVRVTNIFGVNDITHQFWRDYLNPALEQGKLKCAPGSLVVGEGLESLQKALDVQRKGVSAKKVVVTL